MAENFPALMKNMHINIQETQRPSDSINAKRSIARHIVGICWKPRSTANIKKVEKTHDWQDNFSKINRWPIWKNTDGKALGWFCQDA